MNSLTIHIAAPIGRDAELLAQFLNKSGLKGHVETSSIGELTETDRDRAGAFLIAEEALDATLIAKLSSLLSGQPHWSDLPILLLTSAGRETAASRQREHDRLPMGHLTILERPLRPSSLLSAVKSALRARKRQFELRDANAERDNAFVALHSSEQRNRLILESTHDSIELLDLEGNLLSMNEESQRRMEIDDFSNVIGTPWRKCWTSAEESAATDAVASAASGKLGRFEATHRLANGDLTWWDVSVTPVRGEDGEIVHLLAVSREITSRKMAEKALLQSEKLAAVGRLASSISHEINNPLEAVTNLLYIARTSENLPKNVEETLAIADSELQRASQIVGQTLRFHRQATGPKSVTPEELVSSVIVLYRGRLNNSNIRTEFKHAPEVQVTCFDGEIRQVLSNLVGNAIDAMKAGGRLLIRSHRSTCPRTQLPGVAIVVGDTGHGMEPKIAKRIFDAFYSTKGDNGTGLGLWISKGIVDKHHGRLAVRSRRGTKAGTVFRMFLPLQVA